ncbi:LacI family transcriptional regulator [Niabella ginsenosidivorans]|uniref:LacI family transcriptional regulator n=1 Tax=Niabella ginsenosidivorans TaxID=1176587 RepID=A0A1A9I392_9BACT|nr:LacI family DNA-binding transcriptional regulator [Niabella ginsenosidivorans]ANH81795.1 LacI family transcriptional regulator [Niabella ginsenosidivorans]
MKHLSIKDIARIAGVAPSTVSFVVNGKHEQMRLSEDMVKHVQAVIQKTGYVPNRAAASLRTGRTQVIGLIVEDIANAFFASLAKSVEFAAARAGYRVVYGSTENDDKKGNDLLQVLAKQVDGFLIVPSTGMKSGILKLKKNRKPLVLLDRYFPDENIPFVLVDNYGGITRATQYLLDKGKKNIAFVNVALDQIQMHEREKAFTDTLQKQKLFRKRLLLTLPYYQDKDKYIKDIARFFEKYPQIDAVVFSTNYLGMFGIKALKDLNRSIPQQVAVLSFDDTDLFRFSSPAISVVSQPVQEIADCAMQLLLAQMDSRQKIKQKTGVFVAPELIIRNSA